jgi:hypothetical protein
MLKQQSIFDQEQIPESWREEWKDMPEYNMEDKEPFQKIIINFETESDVKEFAKLIDQKLTYKTISIWFPKKERLNRIQFKYVEDDTK